MKSLNIYLLVASFAIAAGSIFYASQSRTKIGVIKLHYVFENFQGAKSAAEELLKSTNKYEVTIDSLKNRISLLSLEKGNDQQIDNLRRVIYELSQKAEYSHGKLNEDLSVGVQNQIDTYLEIYRKEMGYDILIGQYQSTGAIAVGDELDVTKNFTKALNDYYFQK